MGTVDLRGFRDPLEPVRRKSEWELDAAVARLAAARQRHVTSSEGLDSAQQALDAHSAQAALAWGQRADPAAHTQAVGFIAVAHTQLQALVQEEARLRAEVEQAQVDAIERQRKLELLAQHRTRALDEYRQTQVRRDTTQADEAWLRRPAGSGDGGQE